jgi:predicted HicB family RNase H-like nuclease
MPNKGINSYRLTDMEEPTDEMLSQIMKEAAEEAKQKAEVAHKKFFESLREGAIEAKKRWSKKLNMTL